MGGWIQRHDPPQVRTLWHSWGGLHLSSGGQLSSCYRLLTAGTQSTASMRRGQAQPSPASQWLCSPRQTSLSGTGVTGYCKRKSRGISSGLIQREGLTAPPTLQALPTNSWCFCLSLSVPLVSFLQLSSLPFSLCFCGVLMGKRFEA